MPNKHTYCVQREALLVFAPVDVCSHSSNSSKSWYSPSKTSPLNTGGSRGKKFSRISFVFFDKWSSSTGLHRQKDEAQTHIAQREINNMHVLRLKTPASAFAGKKVHNLPWCEGGGGGGDGSGGGGGGEGGGVHTETRRQKTGLKKRQRE